MSEEPEENIDVDVDPICVEFASVGDVICCEVQNPYPCTLRAILSTPEACAYGNELIATGRWRKETR